MIERFHGGNIPKNTGEELEENQVLTPRGIVERKLPSVYIGERVLSEAYEPIHLEHGEVDLFPDAILEPILQDYFENGKAKFDLHKNRPADTSEAERNLRDFYGLSPEPHIVFSTEGSDAILERLLNLLPNSPSISRVGVIGPCFPNIVNFIKQKYRTPEDEMGEGIRIMPISTNLWNGADTTLKEALQFQKSRKKFKPESYFLCLPTTPTGEIYSDEILQAFLTSCQEHEDTVIIDGAFARATGRSAIPLTDRYNNIIALETFNKADLPGLGIGFVAMSPKLKRAYESVRRPLDVRQKMQIHIMNKITEPQLAATVLSDIQNTIYERKTTFMKALEDWGVKYLPTDPRVPIMTIDGEHEGFYDATADVSLGVANGAAFGNTHPDMTSRFVRITAGAVETDKADEVAVRLRTAKALAAA